MNVITFYVKKEVYSFNTLLKFNPSAENPRLMLKEQLREEIIEHMHNLSPTPKGCVHDVVFVDDSCGITAVIDGFEDINKMEDIKIIER